MKHLNTKRIIAIHQIKYENEINHYELITKFGKDGHLFAGRVNKNLANKIAKMENLKIKPAEKITLTCNKIHPISNNCLLS